MKPARVVKYSVAVFVILIFIFAVFAAAFVYFFPKETLRSIIVQTLEKALNRPISIQTIDYSIRGIQIKDLYIYDTTKDRPFIAHAKQAAIRFQLLPLLQKQFIINYIALDNALIHILYYTEKNTVTSNLIELIKELLKESDSTISTEIKSIALSNTTIVLENPPKELKPLEGTYTVGGSLDLHESSLDIKNIVITLPLHRGKITGDANITTSPHFSLEGDFTFTNCDLVWVYKWGANLDTTLPYRNFTGNIHNLIITKHSVQGTVTGSSKLANGSMLYLTNGFCNVNINKEIVTITNAKGKTENSHFVLAQCIFTFDGDIQTISVTDASVKLKEIAPLLGTIDVSDILADIQGNVEYKNKLVNADITLSNLEVGKKGNVLSIAEVSLLIKNNQFQKDGIVARLLTIPCTISVSTVDTSFEKFNVTVQADEVNVDTINFSQIDTGKKPSREITIPYELSGKVTIQKLYKDNLVVEKINTSYAMSKNSIALPSFTAKAFGGDITGRAVVTLSQDNPQITVVAKFSNARLQNISSYLKQYENRLFGIISGQCQLTIVPKEPILDNITGRAEISIENGKFANTGLQNGLSVFLQDLKYKLSNLEFQKIYGNFTLNGPAITINSFIFNAPEIRLKIGGLFHRHDYSDVDIALEFSSNFIQDLPNPALLQLAKYKKGRWYIIPFKAQGKDIFEGKNIKQVQ